MGDRPLMSSTYLFKFAPGNPMSLSQLSPTFIVFNAGSTAVTPPAITNVGNGFFKFSYGPTLPPVSYIIDGGAILNSLDRFLVGVLDPIQAIDKQIGFVSTDKSGSTLDPTTLAGMLKRQIDEREGDSIYSKGLGIWRIFSRGSSMLLRTKQLSDSSSSSTSTGSG